MNYLNNSQKGVSLYFAVVITALLLAVVLGLSAVLISQIKILKEMSDSVIAFFAADSGMEAILYLDKKCYQAGCIPPCSSGCQGLPADYSTTSNLSIGAMYYADVFRCYTFRSQGKFRNTTRAVEGSHFSYKTVFATLVSNGNLGGVLGADTICQNAAASVGLSGTYRAWITNTNTNTQPSTRFATASVPYIRTDCVIVANDWGDLTDGTILAPINRDGNGGLIADDSSVFTNTEPDGNRTGNQPGKTCQNWTMAVTNAYYGVISQSELDADWTATGGTINCNSSAYIYCFQQ